jgi:hypothetical protein
MSDEESNLRFTAYHLCQQPHWEKATIEDVATRYELPDLRAALGDYIVLKLNDRERRGVRRSSKDCTLPFTRVNVWQSVKLQTRSPSDSNVIMPPKTVQATPPTSERPYGWCNTILFTNSKNEAFSSGINGRFPVSYLTLAIDDLPFFRLFNWTSVFDYTALLSQESW